MINTKTTEIFT